MVCPQSARNYCTLYLAIYGMSALLLGASVKSLLPENQTILVCFIVVFPFVVLSVFGWLVSSPYGEGRLVGLVQLVRNSPYGQP